jgi:hypothetical protein
MRRACRRPISTRAVFAISKRNACELSIQQPFATPVSEQVSAVQHTPLLHVPGLHTTPQLAPLQTTREVQLIGPVQASHTLPVVAPPIPLGQLPAPVQLTLHWFVCDPQLMRDWQDASPEQVTSHWAAVQSVWLGHAWGPEHVTEQCAPAQVTPAAQLFSPSQAMSQLSASVHWTPFGQAFSPWQMILQGSPFGHEAPLVHGCASEHVTTHTPARHVPTPAQPCSHFSGSGSGVTLLPSSIPLGSWTAAPLPPSPLLAALVPGSPPCAGLGDDPATFAGVGTALGTSAGVLGCVGSAPSEPATAPMPWPAVPAVPPTSVKKAPSEPHAAIDNAPAQQKISWFENIAATSAKAMPRSGDVRYAVYSAQAALPPSRL